MRIIISINTIILLLLILIEEFTSNNDTTLFSSNLSLNNFTNEKDEEISNDYDDNNNQTDKHHNNTYSENELDSYIHMNSFLLIISMSIAYAFVIIKNLKMIIMKEKRGEYFKVSSNDEGIEMHDINEYN